MPNTQNELTHYGVKGMRWGVRRYQNADGTLTPAGRKKQAKLYEKELNRLDREAVKAISDYRVSDTRADNWANKHMKRTGGDASKLTDKQKSKGIALKNKADIDLNKYRQIESATWKVIGNVMGENYTLSQAKQYKYVMRASDWVTSALIGPVGGSLVTSLADQKKYGGKYGPNETARIIEGNKWKVRA